MDLPQREALLGQLDAVETMLEGAFKQIAAVRRMVMIGAPATGGQVKSGHKVIKDPNASQGIDYTSEAEDAKITEMIGYDPRQDRLLDSLTQQVQEEQNEQTRADFKQ